MATSRYSKLINNIRNIEANITYDNNTMLVTFNWDDASNVSNVFYLTIQNETGSVISQQSSTVSTSSLTYTIPTQNQSYLATGLTVDFDGDVFFLAERGIDARTLWRAFGVEGVLYALLIYMTLSLIGIMWPELAVAAGGVALVGIFMLKLTPLTPVILMWGISILIISIIAMVKNR